MFTVTKRFSRSEMPERGFTTQQDAEDFIYEKLREDIKFKLTATYCLYASESGDLLKEFTQRDVPSALSDSSSGVEYSSGQKGSGQTFSPSPFSSSPRPGGMPQNWTNKDKDDKKD